MTVKKWILAFLLAGLFLLTAFWAIYYRFYATNVKLSHSLSRIHYANNPGVPITHIFVQTVYFVPADQQPQSVDVWSQPLTSALDQTSKFYTNQLGNNVTISFKVYSKAILGQNPTAFYDGVKTDGGNPNALLAIRDELKQRLLDAKGDLYDQDFNTNAGNDFRVLAIVYEGVGGAGWLEQQQSGTPADYSALNNLPTMLVARDFLTKDTYQDYGQTFFAHEFGHTLGLGDHFNPVTHEELTDDIMGSGRYRPLPYTYLSDADKKLLGYK